MSRLLAFALSMGLSASAAAQEPAPKAAPTVVVASSTLWQEKGEEVHGGYSIVESTAADGAKSRVLKLDSSFRTKSGPDLKVVLSPLTTDKVKGKTALQGGVVLGLLRSEKGASEYAIPASVDLNQFRSVLIHCEKYTKLWAAAPLNRGEVIARGSNWTKKSNKIRGHWEIAKVGKKHVLRLGSDFKTSNAPDLKFVLSPLSLKEAKNGNALQGGKILAKLRGAKGAAEYELPADFSMAGFQSLLIHCEQYTKLWGGTALPKSQLPAAALD